MKSFLNFIFSEGSVIVQFDAVYEKSENGTLREDPEKALKNAIQSGELKDLKIYPESLIVTETYPGKYGHITPLVRRVNELYLEVIGPGKR